MTISLFLVITMILSSLFLMGVIYEEKLVEWEDAQGERLLSFLRHLRGKAIKKEKQEK